jgi:hypothetical protein
LDPAIVDDFFDAYGTVHRLLHLSDKEFADNQLKTVNAFWMLSREERERLVNHINGIDPAVFFVIR